MIGPFGGMTAAQALNAVLQHPQRLGEPVALTVNFAAALADGPFLAQARPARTNRSTQHWIVEVRQGDQTVLTATAVTAVRRDTWGACEVPMPEVPRPQDVPAREPAPASNGLRRYDMRFVAGALPLAWDGAEGEDSRTRLWVRDNPPRPLDFASLTALSDVFFPRIWLRRAKLVPIGTVSMTVYFHAGQAQLQATGTGYLLGAGAGPGLPQRLLRPDGPVVERGGRIAGDDASGRLLQGMSDDGRLEPCSQSL